MSREDIIKGLLEKQKYSFDDLLEIMKILRGEGGCPWDREQTHTSIRNDLIEETYEVIEAIDTENPTLLREELGDVLLQVVFHAQIAEEEKQFFMDDVTTEICQKLIHRHPHVFADVNVENSSEVLKNWENIKSDEKSRKTVTDKLTAIPHMLPALMRASKVGKKASCFDFPDIESVMDKISEELVEVSEAIETGNQEEISEEIGDLLLSITSLCRKLGVDAENALTRATDKFIDRFHMVEEEIIFQKKEITECSVEELNAIWDKIKKKTGKIQ